MSSEAKRPHEAAFLFDHGLLRGQAAAKLAPFFFAWRYPAKPSPAKPSSIIAQVDGSGTALVKLKTAVSVPGVNVPAQSTVIVWALRLSVIVGEKSLDTRVRLVNGWVASVKVICQPRLRSTRKCTSVIVSVLPENDAVSMLSGSEYENVPGVVIESGLQNWPLPPNASVPTMTSARAAETVTAVKSPTTRADFEIRIWLPLPIAVEFSPLLLQPRGKQIPLRKSSSAGHQVFIRDRQPSIRTCRSQKTRDRNLRVLREAVIAMERRITALR